MTKTKPQIHIVVENNQPITTSRNVAENFEKNHQHILRDIRNLLDEDVSNFGQMFFEGKEPDSYGREQTIYFMNRDGFTFLAMGFTGAKAREFKLAYIDQFNRMEEHIKQQQIDTSRLSPELQILNQMFQSMAKQELETKRLESKVDGISNLIAMDSKDWRTEAVAILRKIASKQGGHNQYKEVANDSYIRLEHKARCNLNIRLENRRKNMIAQGLGKTAVKKLNRLDIIEEDHRLKQIYMQVIKDMAIKYGVWEEA